MSARITVSEIRRRLHLGNDAVYKLLEAKEIPSVRVGRNFIISRCAYEQWERTFGVVPTAVESSYVHTQTQIH